jgi:DivIVA domain-containing protein
MTGGAMSPLAWSSMGRSPDPLATANWGPGLPIWLGIALLIFFAGTFAFPRIIRVIKGARQDPTGRTLTPEHIGLTPEQVRNMAFSNRGLREGGYNEDEVDAFLDLVEAALQDPTGRTLTAEDVHNVAFSKPPRGKTGYNEAEVNAFLDLVEQEMRHRAPGT